MPRCTTWTGQAEGSSAIWIGRASGLRRRDAQQTLKIRTFCNRVRAKHLRLPPNGAGRGIGPKQARSNVRGYLSVLGERFPLESGCSGGLTTPWMRLVVPVCNYLLRTSAAGAYKVARRPRSSFTHIADLFHHRLMFPSKPSPGIAPVYISRSPMQNPVSSASPGSTRPARRALFRRKPGRTA